MQQLRPTLVGQVIPMDGKSLRGSRGAGENMTYLVLAWHGGAGLVLGQVKTAAKSNEFTAIPQLLDALNIKVATIAIVAMGCQREIVKKVVGRRAYHIVAMKNNHPTLASAVELLLKLPTSTCKRGGSGKTSPLTRTTVGLKLHAA